MVERGPVSDLARLAVHPVRLARKSLLRLLFDRFSGRRIPLHAPDFPLVLLFTEKAGCTSLTKWFLFHVGKLEEAQQYHPWVHHYRRNVLCRQTGYEWQALRLLALRNKPVVKLVRNPYDRAVSSFLSALLSAHGRNSKSWARELVAAARVHAGKPAAEMPAMSFRDFARFLAANGTARYQINGHVARQHVPGEEVRLDRIIKLERFVEEIRWLEVEYGLGQSGLGLITTSRHHRSSGRNDTTASAAGPDLEFTFEEARQGRTRLYDAMYDDETRRLVRQCFAADFEAYGYDG